MQVYDYPCSPPHIQDREVLMPLHHNTEMKGLYVYIYILSDQ